MTIKVLVISTLLKCKRLIYSLRQIGNIHIGDLVEYENSKWVVVNGNVFTADNEQCYSLSNIDTKEYREHIRKSKVKKLHDLGTIKNSALSYYKWWKLYWYRIELKAIINKDEKWYEPILR